MKKRIVITGGTGRLGNELKKVKTNYKLFFPTKKKLDILKINTVRNFLKKNTTKFCNSFGWPVKTNGRT